MAAWEERTGREALEQERLRQERETFDQKQAQDRWWFALKLAMGWTAVVVLPAVCVLAGYVIVNHQDFSAAAVSTASAALFVEAVGVVVGVWRMVLGRGPKELAPVTPRRGRS